MKYKFHSILANLTVKKDVKFVIKTHPMASTNPNNNTPWSVSSLFGHHPTHGQPPSCGHNPPKVTTFPMVNTCPYPRNLIKITPVHHLQVGSVESRGVGQLIRYVPQMLFYFHLDSSGISSRLPLSTISRSDLSGTGGVKMNWPTHQECLSGELFQISPHQDQPCPPSPGWICGG